MTPLVTTEWLAAALGAPDLVVLDATYFLPNERKDAQALFAAAHIAGARFFDIDAISDPANELPHMLPPAQNFARAMAALGVSNGSRVVVYDQRGVFSAPRAWWMLRVFGHAAVAVMDGGLPKWRAEGRPVTDFHTPPAPAIFVPDFHASLVRGLAEMRGNLASGAEIVLDARAAGRFNGSVPEPRPGMKSGHIPGAKSLPFTELLENGVMRPPADLRARFAAAGVDGAKPVVTSCGSGITAAVLTLGLAAAGLPEGALYDGSWSEWGFRDDTAIEV